MFGVLTIVMILMMLEHLPRLLEATRFSGHRGYIVANSVVGLLPEYGGIGLPVGFFLGVALTVRRLALRGELDVIEACGIAVSRWMRLPFTLAAAVSMLSLANQGWLVPAGEATIAEIYDRAANGDFGHRFQAGQLIELGSGKILLFEQVDAVNGDIIGLFLHTEEQTFTARRGRLWQRRSGAMDIELRDGQVVQPQAARVVEFDRLLFSVEGSDSIPDTGAGDSSLKRADIGSLWVHGTMSSRSVVYGRCLWAALVLFLPPLALTLGKPPRRQAGAAGILVGMILLVLGLKMVSPLMDGHARQPEALAVGILGTWGLFVAGLIRAEKVFGQGFVDLWAGRILQNFRRRTP